MHLLARNEIEEIREQIKCGDDETDARIDVLCDMALAQLERTLSILRGDRAMSQALNEGDGSYKP